MVSAGAVLVRKDDTLDDHADVLVSARVDSGVTAVVAIVET